MKCPKCGDHRARFEDGTLSCGECDYSQSLAHPAPPALPSNPHAAKMCPCIEGRVCRWPGCPGLGAKGRQVLGRGRL